MADDFKVIFPPNYTVRGAQSKRDHQTDNALQSLPEQHREQHRRDEQHDRCEFSTDTPAGEDEDTQQEAGKDGYERHALPEPPPPSETARNPEPPKPDIDIDPDADAGELPPGSMLDVEA